MSKKHKHRPPDHRQHKNVAVEDKVSESKVANIPAAEQKLTEEVVSEEAVLEEIAQMAEPEEITRAEPPLEHEPQQCETLSEGTMLIATDAQHEEQTEAEDKFQSTIEMIITLGATMTLVSWTPVIFLAAKTVFIGIVLNVLIYLGLFAVPVISCRVTGLPVFETLGFKRDKLARQLLLSLPIIALISGLFIFLPVYLGIDLIGMYRNNRPSYLLLRIALNIMLFGIVEEVIFRGYLLERFKALTKSALFAALSSAVMFSLWHLPYGHDWVQAGIAFATGFIFGAARVHFKDATTLTVGIAHGAYNSIILIVQYILG